MAGNSKIRISVVSGESGELLGIVPQIVMTIHRQAKYTKRIVFAYNVCTHILLVIGAVNPKTYTRNREFIVYKTPERETSFRDNRRHFRTLYHCTVYIVSRFSEFEKMRDEPSALGYYLLLSGVVYREKRETVIPGWSKN